MAETREQGRAERFARFLGQIEDAFADVNLLGELRQHVKTADLDDSDREALDSRISQYLIDRQMMLHQRQRRRLGNAHGDPCESLPS